MGIDRRDLGVMTRWGLLLLVLSVFNPGNPITAYLGAIGSSSGAEILGLADLPAVAPAASVPVTPAGPALVLKAGMSAIKRTGVWDVPARLRVQSGMGSVVLDFCDAHNPHPVVEIELDLGAGSAKLLLPDDATANVDDLVPGMGSVKSKVPSRPRPGSPHFVVHGRTTMGSVTVRNRFRMGRYFF